MGVRSLGQSSEPHRFVGSNWCRLVLVTGLAINLVGSASAVSNLIELVAIATENKPKFGEPCNHCGWCCLTGPCPVGQELTGKKYGKCALLYQEGDKHYCTLASQPELFEVIGMGTGCDAKTQREVLTELLHSPD